MKYPITLHKMLTTLEDERLKCLMLWENGLLNADTTIGGLATVQKLAVYFEFEPLVLLLAHDFVKVRADDEVKRRKRKAQYLDRVALQQLEDGPL